MTRLHASAVGYHGRGVLITGSAGAGKSGLALQLMAFGAGLVADDSVEITRDGGRITLSCPASISGMIEARGLGILSVTSIDQVGLEFVVDLDKAIGKRLPEPESISILGIEVPLILGKDVPNLGAAIWCLLGNGRRLPTE